MYVVNALGGNFSLFMRSSSNANSSHLGSKLINGGGGVGRLQYECHGGHFFLSSGGDVYSGLERINCIQLTLRLHHCYC